MQLLLASSNPHKIEEIRAIWQSLGHQSPRVDWIGLESLPMPIEPPDEDQPTFELNAALKARYYANASGLWCVADDSGLEVDALGGRPGVHSARFAGIPGPRSIVDPANNLRLLQELGDLPREKRTARFVCAMALAKPGQAAPLIVVRGTVEGRMLGPGDAGYALDNPRGRGAGGFGYDPLFLFADTGQTTAELPAERKNEISHRGAAARLLAAKLREI